MVKDREAASSLGGHVMLRQLAWRCVTWPILDDAGDLRRPDQGIIRTEVHVCV